MKETLSRAHCLSLLRGRSVGGICSGGPAVGCGGVRGVVGVEVQQLLLQLFGDKGHERWSNTRKAVQAQAAVAMCAQ